MQSIYQSIIALPGDKAPSRLQNEVFQYDWGGGENREIRLICVRVTRKWPKRIANRTRSQLAEDAFDRPICSGHTDQ